MFVNLTPHNVKVFNTLTECFSFPASGTVARVDVSAHHVTVTGEGIELLRTVPGEVTGLPDPVPGTWFIVSALVRLALPDRSDLVSPGELVRDTAGQPIGCRGLIIN